MQKRTQHAKNVKQKRDLWHAKNYWDPIISSTINHDSLPSVREDHLTNIEHTAIYTNRLQFEETTGTHDIEGSTKVELNNIRLHPSI